MENKLEVEKMEKKGEKNPKPIWGIGVSMLKKMVPKLATQRTKPVYLFLFLSI